MKNSRGLFVVASCCVAVALGLAGCGRDRGDGGDVGLVDLSLGVAPGVTLDSASYTVTGPAAFMRSGTIDLTQSSSLSATIGGLPAGDDLAIAITATLSDGATTCSGSATFAVMARMTTGVAVHLLCREPPRTGSANIDGTINVCPLIDALSASPAEVPVGSSLTLAAVAHDLDSGPLALVYEWSASAGTISPAGVPSPTFTCAAAAGPVTVRVMVTDGDCTDTLAVVVRCTAAANDGGQALVVKVNEVESNGGVPGDWVELFNPGTAAADLTGWVFRDSDDTHAYVIPAGSSIAAGGTFLLEEAAFGFGLGAADSARLYAPGGVTIVDSFSWTAHAATTYGRCPNGSGDLVTTVSATKGAANDCPGAPGSDAGAATDGGAATDAGGAADGGTAADAVDAVGVVTLPWPGTNAVVTVDELNQFTGNMSGLTYQAAASDGSTPAVLWAVQNGPSMLYKLVFNGTTWVSSATDDWGAGKMLVYPGNVGGPDSEGVTRAEPESPAVYVATERDNTNNGISRLSVLRFDTSAPGTTLVATHEWNLTADLPVVGANLGLEAIAWIPDAFLVAGGFVDESTASAYDPAAYPDHGGGIFFVGVEGNGNLYAYALDHVAGTFHRVATVGSGFPAVMDLAFDGELGVLWAYCDNTCGNRSSILQPSSGRFQVARFIDRPGTLPDTMNNEGITFAPQSECASNLRSFFWADDGNTGGHSLRRDSIPCGPGF